MEVCIVGLDLAKSVFQVHGTDAEGRVLIRRQLRRGEVGKFFSALPQCVARPSGRIRSEHRACEASRNLATIPGIGPITASTIATSVPDPSVFQSGRHFAAWLGLVPRQNSSGGKDRLGRITKMGGAYIRRRLVIGATEQVRHV